VGRRDHHLNAGGYSGGNGSNCVEVGAGPVVIVLDTKDRAGAVLTFGPDAWRRLSAGVMYGTVKP